MVKNVKLQEKHLQKFLNNLFKNSRIEIICGTNIKLIKIGNDNALFLIDNDRKLFKLSFFCLDLINKTFGLTDKELLYPICLKVIEYKFDLNLNNYDKFELLN